MTFFHRFLALLRRAKLDREMDEELRVHIERETEQNLARGMTPEDARYAARRAFGGLDQLKELERDARGWPRLENIVRDFIFAARSLAKHRGFTLLACLILTLGVAGNGIIFSLINGLYLRPLPFPNATRLVDLDETAPKWNLTHTGIKYSDFEGWRASAGTFESMAVWSEGGYNLSTDDIAEHVSALQVTHDLAEVFGFEPLLGRMFTEEEEEAKEKLVLLAHHAWQELFGGREDVIGRSLRLSGEPFTVIGVLPPEAMFPNKKDVWVPLFNKPPSGWFLRGVGRLKPDVTVAQAQTDLRGIHRAMMPDNDITSPVVQPLRDRYLGDGRVIAVLLQATVIVVLLIACANVAGLMMARSLGRSGEFGIRAALGASRLRIARLIVGEGLLLALIGAAGGVLVSQWLLNGYLAWLVEKLPVWVRVEMDVRVLFFIGLLVGLCTVVAGLLPARQVMGRIDINQSLTGGTRQSTAGAGRVVSLRLLVIGEIALATLLLVSAGLLGQAYLRIQRMNPGYLPDNVLKYVVGLPPVSYPDGIARQSFFEEHLRALQALPNVDAASACTAPPLLGHSGNFYEAEGAPPPAPEEQSPVVLRRCVFPGYFHTMRIPFISGRTFAGNDGRNEGSRVAIVNETFARLYWAGEEAVGKRFRPRGSDQPWIEVVGVTRDVKHYGMEEEMRPGLYFPYAQDPNQPWIVFVVRTGAESTTILPAVRTLLQRQDEMLAISSPGTMTSVVAESQWLRRMYSGMITVFALLALIMSIAGVYGVVAYVVGQRTREVGIRMALGADKGNILRLILRDGVRLVATGVALGLAGSFLASPVLRHLLAGTHPFNPAVYLGISGLLFAIALLACLIPAWRATRLNLVDVLRFE